MAIKRAKEAKMNSTAYKLVRFIVLVAFVVSLSGNIAQYYSYKDAVESLEILSQGE